MTRVIEELALTIRTHGLIQPIVVRQYEDEVRDYCWRKAFPCSNKVRVGKGSCNYKNLNDTETASVALIENLQREELTAIEEAVAYQKLIELHNLTQKHWHKDSEKDNPQSQISCDC